MDIATALPADSFDQALAPHFAALRSFMDRRIAELSAEVSASVQLMGMTEDAITGRIAEVHAQIARLIAIPASGARNSGLELEAVVQATESAAETILEAAEAIQSWLDGGAQDAASIAALTQRVNDIFQACSFQDLTGQRIRRAIKQLQQVETMLEGLMPGAPCPTMASHPPPNSKCSAMNRRWMKSPRPAPISPRRRSTAC